MTIRAVLFDFSGTLFRLEEDDSWFAGITVDERAVDGHVQAELMRRLTAPTGHSVDMDDEQHRNWVNRDLEPHLHREAYRHVLRESGLADEHAEALYTLLIDPGKLDALPRHRPGARRVAPPRHQDRRGVQHRVRPPAAFASIGATDFVDEFVLSFEVGAVKPNPEIFQTALTRWVSTPNMP